MSAERAPSPAALRVYRALLEVGEGEVTTYAELARAAGMPGAQRAVGQMMASNPWPGIVPCHRVVRSDARVGGYAYGSRVKEEMLRREGTRIKRGRIVGMDARRHAWGGRRRAARAR